MTKSDLAFANCNNAALLADADKLRHSGQYPISTRFRRHVMEQTDKQMDIAIA